MERSSFSDGLDGMGPVGLSMTLTRGNGRWSMLRRQSSKEEMYRVGRERVRESRR